MKRKVLLTLLATLLSVVLLVPSVLFAADGDSSMTTLNIPLLAGKNIEAGAVSVGNESGVLHVKYVTTDGWMMTETHLAIVESAKSFPVTKKGNPIPGKFEFGEEYSTPVAEDEFTFDLDEQGWTGDRLFIAAHAALVKIEGGEEVQEESAWAAGKRFVEKGNWATYFTYSVFQAPELSADIDEDETAVAELSTAKPYSGDYSYYLYTGDDGLLNGTEARITIPMPEGTTLGNIDSISWMEYLEMGYPPHVDIKLLLPDLSTDALVFEYAYNFDDHYLGGGWPTYNAETGDWYPTFNDDNDGPSLVDSDAMGWLSSGPAGPYGAANFGTLQEWKDEITYGSKTVNQDTIVTAIEIEIDDWLVRTEAYVDDIDIQLVP